MRRLIGRLLHEECGQDVIEYALLTAFIGLVGVVAWQALGVSIGNAYSGWNSGTQNLGRCTPDPGGAGC